MNTFVFPCVCLLWFLSAAFHNFTSLVKFIPMHSTFSIFICLFHFSFTSKIFWNIICFQEKHLSHLFSIYQKYILVLQDIKCYNNMIETHLIFYRLSSCFIKRHGGTLNVYLNIGSQYEKAIYCIIPAVWHAGKCETMETKNNSDFQKLGWREGWKGGIYRIFKALKILQMIPWW